MDVNLRAKLRAEIKPLINASGGSTWKKMYKLLWTLRMFRYAHQKDHIHKLPSYYGKVRGKIDHLVELGFMQSQGEVYTVTDKAVELLELEGYKTELLDPPLTGEGKLESLRKTDVFLEALKLPHFKVLLFPRFGHLNPDGLIVQVENERRYKLTFLEVEHEKADWDNHLEKKKIGYSALGKDQTVYRYWLKQAELLGLEKPTEEQFCFSVWCVSEKKFNYEWEGWKFMEKINDNC